jgi:hypothetical protein
VNGHAATDWRIGREDDVGCSHGTSVRLYDHARLLLHCTLDGGVAKQAAASLGDRPRQTGEIFHRVKARLMRKAERADQILCVQSGRFARIGHGHPGLPAGRQFLIEVGSWSTRSQDQIAVYPFEIARNLIARLNCLDPIYRRSLTLIDRLGDV